MTTIAEATKPRSTANMTLISGPATPQPLPPLPQDPSGGFNSLALGPVPPVLSTESDQLRQWYRGGVSQLRISPLPTTASPSVGAVAQTAVEPVLVVANGAQTTASSAQQAANQALAQSFQGAWDSTVVYEVGASVDQGGSIYLCIESNIDEAPPNATYWKPLSSTTSYVGAWSSTTAYLTGEIVSVSSALYIALQNSTNEDPATTSGYWQILSNTSFYYGTWSSTDNYPVGAQVSYQGNFYVATTVNVNETPSVASSFWTLLGTSAILVGSWSSTTTYQAGMQVSYAPSGGSTNYYIALQASTNQPPGTATNSYWFLITNNTAIASSSSYRPTSNPLTATDAGSNVTITIASFTMNIAGVGAVSVNGGTITGLSYSTVYYIFYADPSISGGTVSFQDATTKTTSISSGVNFFVGSILTPPSGGGTTTGNNDGGTGAQTGGTITIFPTTWTVTAGNGWSSNTAGIDGDPSTWTSPPGDGSAEPGTVVVGGLPAIIFPSTANVVLVLDWECGSGPGSSTSVSVTNPTASLTMPSGNFSRTVSSVSLGANFNPFLTEITINMTSSFLGFSNLYDVYLLVEF
jgi:hypothetical protein